MSDRVVERETVVDDAAPRQDTIITTGNHRHGEEAGGAVVGAVGGAVVGSVVPVVGTVVGAVVGGVAGAVVGKADEDRDGVVVTRTR